MNFSVVWTGLHITEKQVCFVDRQVNLAELLYCVNWATHHRKTSWFGRQAGQSCWTSLLCELGCTSQKNKLVWQTGRSILLNFSIVWTGLQVITERKVGLVDRQVNLAELLYCVNWATDHHRKASWFGRQVDEPRWTSLLIDVSSEPCAWSPLCLRDLVLVLVSVQSFVYWGTEPDTEWNLFLPLVAF